MIQRSRLCDPDRPLVERLRSFIAEQPSGKNRLPPERRLAELFGVGRATLRKALDTLEAEGCLYRHVGRGTFIQGRTSIRIPPLNQLYETTNPLDVMEVRMILEPRAARLAAMRITSAELGEIERTIDRAEASPDTKSFELWDARFHLAVAAASRNELLSALVSIVQATRDSQIWGNVKERTVTRQVRERYLAEHREIALALRMRDAAAAEERMAKHLSGVIKGMHVALGDIHGPGAP